MNPTPVQNYFQTVCNICASLLILKFDGSLRRPSDPYKDLLPTSISSNLPSVATCSSALLADDDKNIIALAGKSIPCFCQTTSADVEYEGLVLGLQMLYFVQQQSAKCRRDGILHNSHKGTVVIVRGDCKTVIDQLIGVSTPRKQRSYYEEVMKIIAELEKDLDVTLEFEHVNRDKNGLCDGMCKVIVQNLQIGVVDDFIRLIANIEENYEEVSLPENRKKRLKFEETHFYNPINLISGWTGYIPLSLRPYLLCHMYFTCNRVQDHVAIKLIGEALRKESKRWKKAKIGIHEEMGLVGLKLVHKSLRSMALEREAQHLEDLIFQQDSLFTGSIDDHEIQLLQKQLPVPREQDSVIVIMDSSQHHKFDKWLKDIVSKLSHKRDVEKPWVIY